MKRGLLTFTIILIAFLKVFSTEQIPDRLIIGKDTFYLKSFPLEELRVKRKLKKAPFDYGEFLFPHTACYRGYVATWKIVDAKLMLIEVGKVDSTNEKLNIIDYLTNNDYIPKIINGFVFAEWYTEKLKRYEMFSGQYRYERFYIGKDWMNSDMKIELKFENGNLVENLIIPLESYEVGDSINLDVSYYRHWLLENGNVNVKGVIKDNNGKMVKLEFISYGTQKKRIIKKVCKEMRCQSDEFWINPRYWNRCDN
jgi:hypothetical protein